MKLNKSITFLVISIIFIIFLFLFMLYFLSPGLGDFTKELPNGYKLERTNSETVFIAGKDSWAVIGANIDGYRVINNFVIGHISKSQLPDESISEKKIGYFILDTKTGDIEKGMSKIKWDLSLRKKGIINTQLLRSPTKY